MSQSRPLAILSKHSSHLFYELDSLRSQAIDRLLFFSPSLKEKSSVGLYYSGVGLVVFENYPQRLSALELSLREYD
jgi:hypothetical protein